MGEVLRQELFLREKRFISGLFWPKSSSLFLLITVSFLSFPFLVHGLTERSKGKQWIREGRATLIFVLSVG